ncbi:MAG: GGDEF domain-containing response regulator [Anaerolineales bacterium]|jgi:diguanylate cyclase (GGDEF)-like protein
MIQPFAMIIEDDRDTVALFRHVLDFAGYKTEIVLRGEKAIERLEVTTPDIILLDLNLPGVPGTEVLKKIKEDDRLKDIPIIVVTGHSHMAMGLQSETDLILLKPVSVDQLTNLIMRLRPVDSSPPLDPPRDELTGLYNRSFFISRLNYSIERTRQLGGGVFGILFIDYDGFSRVEEQKGKDFANQLLLETAKFFRTVIRPIDTISRFNSDRFFIQIEDLTNKEILTKIAERIQNNLSGYLKDALDIDITASIGMVFCGPDYLFAEDIIKDADIALNYAKQDPDTNLVIFNPVKHGDFRTPEKYATILRVGLLPGDPTKPREA